MQPLTALQFMEITSETILIGKAKVMIADGFNNVCKEGSYESSNMQ
jgi:3-oxoacyl-(acyl-carrier-protein) synthase